ncbi:MAG TPA: glycosyltransferase family 39 protein [Solirubrobacteraceae bacterium]|nr:glycosyltransferase family 39 protein [Solirubrobacteraceae bacterium]
MSAAPALLAAVLGLIAIGSRNLGFDEGATVAIVSQHGSALGSAIARDGGNMAAYYLLMHVLVGWFGTGLTVLRLPSVVSLVVIVALIGAIGRRLFDRRVALIAGLLCAVNLPLVYWAQTARAYAPMMAFVCAGLLAFLVLADESESVSRRRWAGAAYVVAMALATYCGFMAVLVVPVQLLALVLGRQLPGLRRLAWALVALAVCCVPLAILAVRRGSAQLFWVPRPSRKVETQVLQSLTSTGLQPSFHPRFTTTFGLVATVLVLLGLAVAVLRARRRKPGRRIQDERLTGWPVALVLMWIAVPVVLTFLYSLVSQPIFLPRNLLICLPAVALALAVVITHPRLGRAWALTVLVVVLVVRAVPLAASYGVSPEPWQAATADVLNRSRPGDCVVFYPLDARNAFAYYVRSSARPAPRAVLPAIRWGATKPFVERYATLSAAAVSSATAGCRRLWFVSSHEGQTDGSARSLANRAGYLRLDARLERAFGRGRIAQYGYASPIHVQLLSRAGGRQP